MRAIGETGLDYYRDTRRRAEQRRAFAAQIEIARDRDLPLVIHLRDPEGETRRVEEAFEMLDARADGVPVILHCFPAPGGSRPRERGWYCSFAGNSPIRAPTSCARRRPAARGPLLVETDSPFLAPQPMRGKPNQPANVVATAEASPRSAASPTVSSSEPSRRTPQALFGW